MPVNRFYRRQCLAVNPANKLAAKTRDEQIDRGPLLARSFTVTLIVVTSGDGKNLI
jgi:hypothetical protein